MKRIINFFREDDGPTAVEYAVMLALIIVVCLVSIRILGQNLNYTYDEIINAQIEAAKEAGSTP
jgi:pilus assembly protein Flp/PilA